MIDHIDSENFSYDYARLSAVKFDYDYALVVKGDVKSAKESIVYKQLLKINKDLQGMKKE